MTRRKGGRRVYERTISKRIAAFVAGRTGITRDEFKAVFPTATCSVVALLVAMGHIESAPSQGALRARITRLEQLLANAKSQVGA